MIRVMVSLDLVNAEPQREEFYKMLAANGWTKLTSVDTVWTFSKMGSTKEEEDVARSEIAKLLTEAAKEFKPTRITYVAQIGNNSAIERVVEKRVSDYGSYNA